MDRNPSPSDSPAAASPRAAMYAAIERAVSVHNLMLFTGFVVGLGALGVQYWYRWRIEDSWSLRVSEALRVALPIVALLATGVYTTRSVRRLQVGARADGPPVERVAGVFRRTKTVSSIALGLALVVAAGFLAVCDRVLDFGLAALAFVLFFVTRPSLPAFNAFAGWVAATSAPVADADSQD